MRPTRVRASADGVGVIHPARSRNGKTPAILSSGDIVTRSTAAGAPGGLTRGPSREDAANRLFADLDPAMKEWALARYTQHPAGIYTEGVVLDKFWSMPWEANVIWCKQAQNPGEAHQRRCAERLKAPFMELDTGHYPMLSMPAELTALILKG